MKGFKIKFFNKTVSIGYETRCTIMFLYHQKDFVDTSNFRTIELRQLERLITLGVVVRKRLHSKLNRQAYSLTEFGKSVAMAVIKRDPTATKMIAPIEILFELNPVADFARPTRPPEEPTRKFM